MRINTILNLVLFTMHYNSLIPEINVSNFQKSLDFYTSIIGFTIKYQREEPNFAFLELNESQLMIEEVRHDSWLAGELIKPYGRGINLSIRSPDIEHTKNKVIEFGLDFFEPIYDVWYETEHGEPYGQRQFIVSDPDGYLLRMTQEISLCASSTGK
ncbi:MAG: lactoylglutathione lyase [Oceanicoccus sp.]|jgi:lactoylglutathione lyase